MKPLYILFILSAIGFTSCIDEDLNIDPNRPSSVPTTSLISTAQKHLTDNVRSEQASLRSSALFVQQISQITYTANRVMIFLSLFGRYLERIVQRAEQSAGNYQPEHRSCHQRSGHGGRSGQEC